MTETKPPPEHEPTLTEDVAAARARHPGWTIRVSRETGRIWCTTICPDTSGLTVDCGDVLQVDRIIAEAEHIAAMRRALPGQGRMSLDAWETDQSGSSGEAWGVAPAATTTLPARVNAILPHTAAQVGLLHYLLVAMRGSAEFTAAIDAYLADKQARRQAAAS